MRDLKSFRVVAVHAHPDDEALFTGGTLASLARRGADVTLITATLGDLGEVIGETYQGLIPAGLLGGLRARELADAAQALGIHAEFLGAAGSFRDSGMADMLEAQSHPRALVNRVDEAAELLSARFVQLRPHVVLTYGPDGGYGHPDHIAVHQATMAAAADHGARVWWAIFERAAHREALEGITPPKGWTLPPEDYLDNFTNAGADVVYPLDDAAWAAKRAAMACHPTQIWVADGTVTATNPHAAQAGIASPELAPGAYALSNLHVMPLLRAEHFQAGARAEGASCLFDGLVAGE